MTDDADAKRGRSSSTVPTTRQRLHGWLRDYTYVASQLATAAISRTPPHGLLQPSQERESPVLLIPGVYESWRFMQPVADHLHHAGHPVHVLESLGYNTQSIPNAALVVREYLERLDLTDVTIIAHSKGGLIAKRALTEPGTLARARHLIAINTPFSGSRYASLFWLPSLRMFTPTGPIIQELALNRTVNSRISSLYSVFDPHIPETSHLEGGENIVLPTIGHFRPLADPGTLALISEIMARRGTKPR